MSPTAYNNAVVAVVSAYAEAMQELSNELVMLRAAVKAAKPPDEAIAVSRDAMSELAEAMRVLCEQPSFRVRVVPGDMDATTAHQERVQAVLKAAGRVIKEGGFA